MAIVSHAVAGEDGIKLHCAGCGAIIGRWLGSAVVELEAGVSFNAGHAVQVPAGVGHVTFRGVWRLSGNARRRIAEGKPARSFKATRVPAKAVMGDAADVSAFFHRALGTPALAPDQRDQTVTDYREQAEPPFIVECHEKRCRRLNRVVSLDTA